MLHIVLLRNTALGNGNRKAGEVLGTVSSNFNDVAHAANEASWACSSLREFREMLEFNKIELELTLADGVEDTEILTLFRNPGHWEPQTTIQLKSNSTTSTLKKPPAKNAAKAGATKSADDDLDSLSISEAVKKSLRNAGLDTIEKIHAYATENKGLTSVTGIGDKSESDIVDALLEVDGGEGDGEESTDTSEGDDI